MHAHAVNAQFFRTGRHTKFKLGTQTEHEDPYQRQKRRDLPKVKGEGRKVRDSSEVLAGPISRERNVLETPKLVGMLPTQNTHSSNNAYKFRGQRSHGQQYCSTQ